ncbi:MAG TPA: DUF3333 domain-containing protein, partial [Caulobacteraceae bacterium]|nr:DUF3333 domain-containing protein [Caulobacteraceae bacterium]
MTDTERLLKKRHGAERRFRLYGRIAIVLALSFLALLLVRVTLQGYTTFTAHSISLPVHVDPARVDASYVEGSNFDALVAEAMLAKVGAPDGDVSEARELLSRDMGFQLL